MKPGPGGSAARDALDVLAVAAVAAITIALPLPGLGFYSDDWDFLALFGLNGDQSVAGLYAALGIEPHMAMRPGQKLYDALLFHFFGLSPLGYHLTNACVLVAGAALLLLALRELGLPRALGLGAALLFPVLPHYSTARVWYASFQASLSLTLFVLSLWAGLRALTGRRAAVWVALSLAAAVASGLCYEAALPLFFLNAALFAVRGRALAPAGGEPRRTGLALAAATAACALGVAAFKAQTSTRLSHGLSKVYVAYAVTQLGRIHLWTYGAAAPRTLWRALHLPAPWPAVAAGAAAVLAIAYAATRRAAARPSPGAGRAGAAAIAAGALVTLLAYAVFATTEVSFSPTGANNRTAMPGAIGVALAGAGGIIWLGELVGKRLRAGVIAGLVALSCTGAFVVTQALAAGWVRAYAQERRILASIRRALPAPRPGTTVLLGGACRFEGPAPVFEAPWDLQGALRLAYRDSTLLADVVSPETTAEADGIHTVVYGSESRYPYERLLLFDARSGSVVPLRDAVDARARLAALDVRHACPPGRPGSGVRDF